MRRLDQEFIRKKVEFILTRAGQIAAPIDLAHLAKIQCVRTIELRPMVLEGCIQAIPGGFKIFVQNRNFQSFNLDEDPELKILKPRQRFSLAHELTHTFFYDFSTDPPTVSKDAPKLAIMESLCQYGASQILLPERLLTKEIDRSKPLTSYFAVELARKFGTSPEAVIRRIDSIDKVKTLGRALIFARIDESAQDAQIRSVCYHTSLLPYLPKPELYSSLKEWCGSLLEEDFWNLSLWDQSVRRGAGVLFIRKRSYTAQERSFFLEVELSYSL